MDVTIALIIKGAFLLGLSLYTIFAFVVVRQVSNMTKTLEVGFETPIKIASLLHLLFAIGTFIVAFLVL